MTAQIPDRYFYNDKQYDLIGVKGEKLFTPEDYGMQPIMISTACYRGFYCTYAVEDKKLLLKSVVIRSKNGYQTINGVEHTRPPRKYKTRNRETREWEEHETLGDPTYDNVNLQIPFTGGLLFGADFIGSYYVHMGFQKPHAFNEVVEMLFTDGNLTDVFDHSERAAEMRKQMQDQREAQENAPKSEDDKGETMKRIENHITFSFSLDYGDWWV